MVGISKLSTDDQVELIRLQTHLKNTQKRIQEILKGVKLDKLPADVNESKYDILVEEMVPPEALDSPKEG